MYSKIERSNVACYYLFAIFREPILWGPILITYIAAVAKMSLSEIYFMEACCVIIASIVQVPTGAFADTYGRARSIQIGMLLIVCEVLIFSLSTNKLMIWLANTFWAIGYSFMSGADSSLLKDSLTALGREDEFKKIHSRANGIKFGIVTFAVLFVGYLAEKNIRLPLRIDTGIVLTGFVISLFFNDKHHTIVRNNHEKHNGKWFKRIKRSLVNSWNNKMILWLIVFGVIVSVVSKLWFFTYNKYFELNNIPLRYYGYIFAGLNLVACLSSWNASRLIKSTTTMGGINIIFGCIAIPLIMMGLIIHPLSAVFTLAQNIVRGFAGTFSENIFHKNINSADRATMISVKSMYSEAAEVVCMLFFSYITSIYTLQSAILGLGIFTFIAWFIMARSFKKYFGNH